MNSRTFNAFLVAATISLSGCVVYSHGGGGGGGGGGNVLLAGDVTMQWTLAGGNCNDFANVKSVAISIPGESLQNNGVYPCLVNNFPGVVLHDFAGGTYNFTIEADDFNNQPVFTASGAFTVNGAITVTTNMVPVGGGDSFAYMSWAFPPNSSSGSNPASCNQAGIAFVDAYFDGSATPKRYDCVAGQTNGGVSTPFMPSAVHSLTLIARTSSEYVMYRKDASIQTSSSGPVSASYSMEWAVGGAVVGWTFNAGNVTYTTCGQAAITNIQVNFRDSAGNDVYGPNGDAQACSAEPVVYSFLQPGTYQVFVKGTGTGGTYFSDYTNPPVVIVQAGSFPGPANALNVTMYKQ